MDIVKNTAVLSETIAKLHKQNISIGFVPTMGALHEGHLSLVEKAVNQTDYCIASIFVNPTQFNNKADLEKYPRNFERDFRMLAEAGCKLVFCPSVDQIYCSDELEKTFDFDFEGLDKVMEGKFRPAHFNGVVQIVSKLFQLVKPHKAFFGEKDFQQLAIIHLMVKKMNFPVEIVDCPIVREPDGLAMSSRNERLNASDRKNAARISQILFESQSFVSKLTPDELKALVEEKIDKAEGLKLEYFEIADVGTLQKVTNWSRPAIGCIAVFCGEVRLIDNIRY